MGLARWADGWSWREYQWRDERLWHPNLEYPPLNLRRSTAQRARTTSAHDNVMGCVPCIARFGTSKPTPFFGEFTCFADIRFSARTHDVVVG